MMEKRTINIIIFTLVIGYVLYKFMLWLIPYIQTENEKKKSLLLLKQRQQQRHAEPDIDALINDTITKENGTITKSTSSKFKLTNNTSNNTNSSIRVNTNQNNISTTNANTNTNNTSKGTSKFTLKLPNNANDHTRNNNNANNDNNNVYNDNNNTIKTNESIKIKKKQQEKKIFLDRVVPDSNPWINYNTNNNSSSNSNTSAISEAELEIDRNLRRQQDMEYEASLAVDRQRLVNADNITNDNLNNDNNENINKEIFYARRASLLDSIPSEPDKDDDLTISICFRFQITTNDKIDTPARLERRFYKTDRVMLLVNFVESISTLPYYDSIEISTSYPKSIIYSNTNATANNDNDNDKTLIDLNLESNSIIWVSICKLN